MCWLAAHSHFVLSAFHFPHKVFDFVSVMCSLNIPSPGHGHAWIGRWNVRKLWKSTIETSSTQMGCLWTAYWLFLGNSPKTKWLQFQACKQAIHQNTFPFFPDWPTISPGTNITVSHFYDDCINQPQLPHVKEKLIVAAAERRLHVHAWKE